MKQTYTDVKKATKKLIIKIRLQNKRFGKHLIKHIKFDDKKQRVVYSGNMIIDKNGNIIY